MQVREAVSAAYAAGRMGRGGSLAGTEDLIRRPGDQALKM